MAFKEIYIDPAIAADSGAGTVGDPYGDLDYAIVQETQGTAGTRLNIKRGTDEVLTREIGLAFGDTSVSAAWTYSVSSPIILQGYDTAAGDLAGTGNRAGISGGGSNIILNGSSANYIAFIDLHLHNTGSQSNGVVRTQGNSALIRCELDNNTGRGCILGSSALVVGCYFHDFSTYSIDVAAGSFVYGNIVTNTGSRTTGRAINLSTTSTVMNNIVSIDGASNGIFAVDRLNSIIGNSIYSDGGTGSGIIVDDVNGVVRNIANNLIEGFSGTGGVGINLAGTTPWCFYAARNLIFNCTDAVTTVAGTVGVVDNGGLADFYEVLSASPFADAAGFDFSPVDVGNVREGAYPPSFMTI